MVDKQVADNLHLSQTRLEFPVSFIIIFTVGWILILLGFVGNSIFLESPPLGRRIFYWRNVMEPWYSISTATMGIGFMFLAIFHLLLSFQFKFNTSFATIPILLVTSLYLLAIAQNNIGQYPILQIPSMCIGAILLGILMIFAVGLHGYEIFLLGKWENNLRILGILTMFLGLPFVIIYHVPRPFHVCIPFMGLLYVAIMVSMYKLNTKGLLYPQGRKVRNP